MGSIIGIFDSGVGGLSVWKQIDKLLPNQDSIYIADQKHFPYGNKSDSQILKRSEKITEFLLRSGASLIVIACNTATVTSIKHLRNKYKIPFVGVEPAVKPAAKLSINKEIFILGTEKTVNSKRQKDLMRSHATDINIRLTSSPEFVRLVETGEIKSNSAIKQVKKFFLDNPLEKADVLVLGCTHYPFLKEIIREATHGKIKIIEPSNAVAKQIKVLKGQAGKRGLSRIGIHRMYTTGDPDKFQNVVEKLLKKSIKVKKISI
jgi:glutamate racemase